MRESDRLEIGPWQPSGAVTREPPCRTLVIVEHVGDGGPVSEMALREPVRLTREGFDAFMASCRVELAVEVPAAWSADPRASVTRRLRIDTLAGLDPDQLLRQIPEGAELLRTRSELAAVGDSPVASAGGTAAGLGGGRRHGDEAAGTDPIGEETAPDGMAADGRPSVSGVTDRPMIDARIADIDAQLGAIADAILDAPGFRELEGAWRGLADLLDRTANCWLSHIDAICIRREELHELTSRCGLRGASSQIPVIDAIAATRPDRSPAIGGGAIDDGEATTHALPYAQIVHTGSFGPGRTDLDAISMLGRRAYDAGAVLILGAAPECLGLQSWAELDDIRAACPRERIEQDPRLERFRSARAESWAAAVCLVMPGVRVRSPWGALRPCGGFEYVEGASHGDRTVCSPVYGPASLLLAATIVRAVERDGWAAAIAGPNGSGRILGLPAWPAGHGDPGGIPVTEVALTCRQVSELAKEGLVPVVPWPGSGRETASSEAVFASVPTLGQGGSSGWEDEQLVPDLAVRLTAGRVWQCAWIMVRGGASESEVNAWLRSYVMGGQRRYAPRSAEAAQPLDEGWIRYSSGELEPAERPTSFECRIDPGYLIPRCLGGPSSRWESRTELG